MILHHKDEAIETINRLGSGNEPFLFFTDYGQNNTYIGKLNDIDSSEILYSFPLHSNSGTLKARNPERTEWDIRPETFQTYRQKFDNIQRNLHAGNSFLTNLTCKVPVKTNLTLRDIFLRSEAKYRLWVDGRFVCFSPETFVRIKDGTISGYPMKGTIDATLDNAEQQLMDNGKEAAEHATIVDLIRNDLSIVAKKVEVSRYRYVEKLKTEKGGILQTSSEISGRLPGDYRNRLGEIVFSQLPAGSITGAPKARTVEIISQTEDYCRGFYTGVMGIFDNGNLDSAVMIRFVEQENDSLYFKAGGGITAYSDCKSEYHEIIQKTDVPIR